MRDGALPAVDSRGPGVGSGALATRFFPLEGAIHFALIWVCLPLLLVEFWDEAVLREVLQLVGEMLLVNECTAETKQPRFARACIRIDLS